MPTHCRVCLALCLVLACGRPSPAASPVSTESSDSVSKSAAVDLPDVVWTTPSANSRGSMPIGNGDIGANVWVEPSGDLVFFISKTDAWDENMRLVKIGKVRVKFTPPLVQPDKPFRQTLDLASGRILVETDEAEVSFWIDAHHPVIQLDVKSLGGRKLSMTAATEPWRTSKQPYKLGYPNFSGPAFSWPDTPLKSTANQIGWFHRNVASPWLANLKLQKLEAIANEQPDPILHRTFGAILRGEKLKAIDEATLSTSEPAEQLSLRVHVLTQTEGTAESWRTAIEMQADRVEAISAKQRFAAHSRWWNDFWNRSWIRPHGNPDADSASRAYALQRWMTACAGRGKYPIKFNGSIFVIDHDNKTGRDADYRAWGGCYWWQNTRLIYWPMLTSGDFEMMRPLFKMYWDALPSRKLATRTYYGHDGAFFPETMTFWGTYNDKNYGPNRTNKPDGMTDNSYIRRYWQGGIEMVALMLDYYDGTRDARFRDETLIPFATEIVAFFDLHWQRGSDGTILFKPAQSLETWHTATNPLPEIAGLRFVLPRLQAVTRDAALKANWQKTIDALPPIPLGHNEKTGEDYLQPADRFTNLKNTENPELYAVFPYRLYTVAADPALLAIGNNTWVRRRNGGTGGWQQNAIQAPLLGRADEAGRMVASNSKHYARGYRFPAMWGPNYDWIPDQDHGSVILCALQRMLMQCEGDRIILLPAWPKTWNCSFKLQAPGNTTVAGTVTNGKLLDLKVTPETRRKDVQIQTSDDVHTSARNGAELRLHTTNQTTSVARLMEISDPTLGKQGTQPSPRACLTSRRNVPRTDLCIWPAKPPCNWWTAISSTTSAKSL